MQLDALLWLFLPVVIAAGSAWLSFHITQARADVALAKGRESLAAARATIRAQKVILAERIKATEESARRAAMDELMRDLRLEERTYAREGKTASSGKRSMILQERLYFRNIPLSNWTEREMVLEEGTDLEQLPQAGAPFAGELDWRGAPVREIERVVTIPAHGSPRHDEPLPRATSGARRRSP